MEFYVSIETSKSKPAKLENCRAVILPSPTHGEGSMLNYSVGIDMICFFKKLAILGLFFFIFVFSIQLTVNV